VDNLCRLSIGTAETRAQNFVAPDDLAKRLFQRGTIQRSVQPDLKMNVKDGGLAEFLSKPEALLSE